jgi:predicted small lipoprotein YifL
MLPLCCSTSARSLARRTGVALCALLLAACGVKGPLVPAPKAAATPPPPPPATTAPQIPSATPNDPQRPPAP